MFESVQTAPPDSILGITEAFNKDPNPSKINLSIGVFRDATGKTPVLQSVKAAEEKILRAQASKNYVPIEGAAEYGKAVKELMFGAGHEAITSNRCATAHTPGGTAALRVAADYIKKNHKGATAWMSEPTWPNHPQIFEAAGVAVKTYPYFDAKSNSIAWEAMLAGLKQIPSGDVVLLHGCCHNPSGVDPTREQWKAIADTLHERKALPLLDFAYQGFADGLREDGVGLTALAQPGRELLVCSSFSKNFGLYNERVGALTIVAATEQAALAVLSQVKTCIRANYSNPPAHGGAIVSTILGDASLRAQWETELTQMRERIQQMRKLFTETLTKKGVKNDTSFITRQKGMFSFSGLNKGQVERLKKEQAIYIVGTGRINVAGMTEENMDRLCTAIAGVM